MPFDPTLLERVSGFDPALLVPIDDEGGESAEVAESALEYAGKISDAASKMKEGGTDYTYAMRRAMLADTAARSLDIPGMAKALINQPNRLMGLPDIQPAISPEAATKVVQFFNPMAPSSEGSLQQGVEQGLGGMASGLTEPENLAALVAAKRFPVPVARMFQGEMIGQIPEATRQLIQAKTPAEVGRAGVGLAANVALPAGIEKGLNASRIEKATEVHGDVQPLEEPAKEVPAKESGEGVQQKADAEVALKDAQEIITEGETRKGLPEKIAADVDAMTPAEFAAWKTEADRTGRLADKQPAYSLGEKAPNEAFVQELARLRDKWKKAGDEAIAKAAAEQDPAKQIAMLNDAQPISQKGQFFREAYERATGTGSATDPGYEPPFQKKGVDPNAEKEKGPEETVLSKPKEASELGAEDPHPVALGIVPPGSSAIQGFINWVKDGPRKAKVMLSQLAGKSAPNTSVASEESGNALIHYASAKIAAPTVARSMATDVLGPHHKDAAFGLRLGAVLVEDRLRAIREAFVQAGEQDAADAVGTVIGKDWSPLKTGLDFRKALADPEIQAAIERHKATVQPRAEEAHQAARGQLSGPGLHTGAFVNLKAILEGIDERQPGGAARGNLENPLRRLSRFFKQAKGTAGKYEIDYRTLAERMITGNFEEAAKRQMYTQLVDDGLAVINDPGDAPPELGNKPPVKFTIERRGTPMGTTAEGAPKARTYIKNLWVRADIAGEVRQALNTDGAVAQSGFTAAANLINKIQLAGPTDAVWHTANMLGSIAGSQGGKNILVDLARKLPGVNIADAVGRTVASGIRVLRDSPDIQRQLADISEIGALRGQHKAGPIGRVVQFIDKAGRLVRDDLFKNLVERGLVDGSEASRREFVNQMGQYNGRLMGQFQRFFKEAGFSPFIVAGRNFNRMAARRLTLDPGVKAASPTAAAEMRAIEAFGTIATLFAIPAFINYMVSGNTRPDLKMGQIGSGKKDSDGKEIVIDPSQWTGLRRGLRISGAQAVTEGLKRGDTGRDITRTAAHDMLGGILHPWTGPAVTAATVATTGYDPRFYKESVNPKDVGENIKAALQQLNPVAASIIKSKENDQRTALGEIGKQLGGAVGVKAVQPITPLRQMTDKAAQFKVAKGYGPKGWTLEQTDEPSYTKIRSAIRAGDEKGAMKLIQKLRETIPDKQIAKAMEDHTKRPLTGSKAHEKEFMDTLDAKNAALYDAARDEQKAEWEKFRAIWDRR